MSEYSIKTFANEKEREARNELVKLFRNSPIPDDQILLNLGLFINSKTMARILFMNYIYQKIVDIPGVVFEFGCHWGQNSVLFSTFRGIYEPFNRHRKIVAFDTFDGFPSIDKNDGTSDLMEVGNLKLPLYYEDQLKAIMQCHENDNPLNHIKKHEVVKGDASVEVQKYLTNHPETIISLAYFDFDIYQPTKDVLGYIKDRITKGTVIAFDELNDPDSPGETIALMEIFGLNNIELKRYRYASRVSYFVVK